MTQPLRYGTFASGICAPSVAWRRLGGPRYEVIGNSMAVPVLDWIGRRIQEVHNLP